ncbi:MAG: hypothetical protein OQK24_07770 [Magnetovibrio sp.]|nr:hypothetical protein [Magnetovibrio sp.]
MAQTLGILGFTISLLALFIASEVMRRASQRQVDLETALAKLSTRFQKIESSVFHVEKLAAEIRHQRRRQADTLTSLANKGDGKVPATSTRSQKTGSGEQFTPSSHQEEPKTRRKTG